MYGLTIQNVRPLKKIISEFLMSAYIKMFYDTSLLPMNTYPTVGYVFIAITDKKTHCTTELCTVEEPPSPPSLNQCNFSYHNA